MANLNAVLTGAVAMASLVAMMFFIKFWHLTGDRLFLLFAIAFGVDAGIRAILGAGLISAESEPLFYMGRLVTFGLIVLAIANKNRGHTR